MKAVALIDLIENDMYIAVCDDNPVDREIIVMILHDYAVQNSIHFNITEYSSAINLVYDMEEGHSFNIIFLDIYMDEILGIDAACKNWLPGTLSVFANEI